MGADRIERVESAVKHHPDPVVTATEISDELGDVSRRDVLDDLRVLERTGELERKKVGARAVAWWHTERVVPAPPKDPADHPDQRALEETADPGRRPDRDADGADQEPTREEIIDGLDLSGSGDTLEARREAVRACCEYLRENGEATKSDFVSALYDEHRAGYQSTGGWWNTIGKDGLRTVAERVDHVNAPGEGEHVWFWTG